MFQLLDCSSCLPLSVQSYFWVLGFQPSSSHFGLNTDVSDESNWGSLCSVQVRQSAALVSKWPTGAAKHNTHRPHYQCFLATISVSVSVLWVTFPEMTNVCPQFLSHNPLFCTRPWGWAPCDVTEGTERAFVLQKSGRPFQRSKCETKRPLFHPRNSRCSVFFFSFRDTKGAWANTCKVKQLLQLNILFSSSPITVKKKKRKENKNP